MRLLEFETASSGANPQVVIRTKSPARKPARKAVSRNSGSGPITAPGQVFDISGNNAVQQAKRQKPIDLEQLQQRIEILERRMRERARTNGNGLRARELEQLKQRMKLLERSVHNELWSARQREHTLLEMLARPPLGKALKSHAGRLCSHTVPTAYRQCMKTGGELWNNHLPAWWHTLARTWQESLDRARGINPA